MRQLKFPEYWIVNSIRGYVLVLQLDPRSGAYKEIGEYRGTELISSALLPDFQVAAETLLAPF